MKREVPVVDFTCFGEQFYVTDYIQVDNPQLQEIADALRGTTEEECFQAVLTWMNGRIEYPMTFNGRPTAAQICKAFKCINGIYKKETPNTLKDYSWRFPNQTVTLGMGICFDSSCVCTTLFRLLEFKAYTVLGGIRDSEKEELLGLHAWTEIQKQGEWCIVETTMEPQCVRCKQMYTGELEVWYDPFAWFNEKDYFEDQEKVGQYYTLVEDLM